jgi:hypothetical protein
MKEIYLNPLEDRIIGVVDNNIYFKSEYRDYVLIITEIEYIQLVKQYINTKRDFCKRYNHFCGVFGEFSANKYERLTNDFVLNQPFDVEDDGNNDGLEIREVQYPIYFVHEFDKHCDMEHG